MTQENKELLLNDLCARLLYGVKCKDVTLDFVGTMIDISMHDNMCKLFNDYGDNYTCFMMNCKPYLFPLSNMIEEQEIIYGDLCYAIINSLAWNKQAPLNELLDWLNKNHFDYRGLIEKGLAIDATNLNIY